MLLSRHQNAGQSHDMKIANISFDNMAQFKYLGTTVTKQNLIQKEIKSRLNSVRLNTTQFRNFGLHVCCLKHKNWNTKIIILPVVLYGCET
jgi:hypothetical protein